MRGITYSNRTKVHKASGSSIHMIPVAKAAAMEPNFRRRQEREERKKHCCDK